MKRMAVPFASLLLVLLLSSPSHALLQIGAKAGYANPMGDFGDSFDGAMAYGLRAEIQPLPRLGIEAAYVRHTHEPSGGGDAELEISDLTIDARFYLIPGPVRPFLAGGVGFYAWKMTSGLGDDSGSEMGWNAGAGVAFDLSKNLSLGAEAMYHSFKPEDSDEAVNYLNLLGAVSFKF